MSLLLHASLLSGCAGWVDEEKEWESAPRSQPSNNDEGEMAQENATTIALLVVVAEASMRLHVG